MKEIDIISAVYILMTQQIRQQTELIEKLTELLQIGIEESENE